MMTRKFKVLLVYPNLMLVTQLPNNIATLSACIKDAGHDIKVFDTTLYKTSNKTVDDTRVERLQVRPFNIKDIGVNIKTNNIDSDFLKVLNQYQPDLIGVSVLDDTVNMGISLINIIQPNNIPVLFGGVYATFNYDKLIKEKNIDYVCIGEGEKPLIELCDAIKNKKNTHNINNIITKENQKIKLNTPADINNLPMDDFSVFENNRIFRPMQGKMVASIPINFDRGCPYQCSFCNAPGITKKYKEYGFKYYRRKNNERIHNEINHQIKSFPNVSFLYFNSETFLNTSIKQLKEFADMYRNFNLPFWCQSRIETINEEKIKILKSINCDRISIGIEHGNEDFRKNVLKKTFTNQQVIDAFEILNKHKIKTSVNNIIGFPGETRELIFDTIELNRKIKCDSINGFVFQPYRGTTMRQHCVDKKYLLDENITDNLLGSSVLTMPQLSRKEIDGLLRTFVLYVKLPKKYYSKIKVAEKFDDDGNKMFSSLKEKLYNYYFKGN